MVVFRKKKEVAPVEPSEPADWENNIEDVEDEDEDPSVKLAKLKEQIANTEAQTQVYNKELTKPQQVVPPQSTLGQPPAQSNRQARIKKGIIREDGFHEYVVETNYPLGNIGDFV